MEKLNGDLIFLKNQATEKTFFRQVLEFKRLHTKSESTFLKWSLLFFITSIILMFFYHKEWMTSHNLVWQIMRSFSFGGFFCIAFYVLASPFYYPISIKKALMVIILATLFFLLDINRWTSFLPHHGWAYFLMAVAMPIGVYLNLTSVLDAIVRLNTLDTYEQEQAQSHENVKKASDMWEAIMEEVKSA